MTTAKPSPSDVSHESMKLGIDAHAKYHWGSRQVDGATPQPVQKMTEVELMLFVAKQQKPTDSVVACDEGRYLRGTSEEHWELLPKAQSPARSSFPRGISRDSSAFALLASCYWDCAGASALRISSLSTNADSTPCAGTFTRADHAITLSISFRKSSLRQFS